MPRPAPPSNGSRRRVVPGAVNWRLLPEARVRGDAVPAGHWQNCLVEVALDAVTVSSTPNADLLVKLASENASRFTRDYLRQAVCELRFPTLLSLAGAKPPTSFATALRHQYPILDAANEVTVNLGANAESVTHHVFRSVKGTWTVTLKPSAAVIETTRYTSYAELRERSAQVIAALQPVIDSDFFTRIGLRYVNLVETSGERLSEWINPQLLGPIDTGLFSGICEYAGKFGVQADDGGCLLQHGLRMKQPPFGREGADTPLPDYVIDIDVFRHEVAIADALPVIDRAHSQEFAVFDWAMGPRARAYLRGESP